MPISAFNLRGSTLNLNKSRIPTNQFLIENEYYYIVYIWELFLSVVFLSFQI